MAALQESMIRRYKLLTPSICVAGRRPMILRKLPLSLSKVQTFRALLAPSLGMASHTAPSSKAKNRPDLFRPTLALLGFGRVWSGRSRGGPMVAGPLQAMAGRSEDPKHTGPYRPWEDPVLISHGGNGMTVWGSMLKRRETLEGVGDVHEHGSTSRAFAWGVLRRPKRLIMIMSRRT